MSADTPGANDPESDPADDSMTVLELFGVELKVRNSRLAEVLTMQAGEALSTDVRQLISASDVDEIRENLAEALPDVMVMPKSARDLDESRARAELRARADGIASILGFEVSSGGVWESPTGVSVVTRVIEHSPSFASAVDLADKFSQVLSQRDSEEVSALLVVDSQQTADVCKVAIRQRRLYDVMRTISLENLEQIRDLFISGAIEHARALVLLSPLADIDVGEVLSIVRSAVDVDCLE